MCRERGCEGGDHDGGRGGGHDGGRGGGHGGGHGGGRAARRGSGGGGGRGRGSGAGGGGGGGGGRRRGDDRGGGDGRCRRRFGRGRRSGLRHGRVVAVAVWSWSRFMVVLAIVLVVMFVAVAVAPSSGYKLPLLPVQTLKLTMTPTAHIAAATTDFPYNTTLAEVLNAMSLTALPALCFQSLRAQHLQIWVRGPGLIASGVRLRFLPVVLCKAKSTHKTAEWFKNEPEMLFSLHPQMLEKCVLRCMCLWPGA